MKKLILFWFLIMMCIGGCDEKMIVFECEGYANKDGSNHYEIKVNKTEVDVATFKCLGNGYGKDKNTVFRFHTKTHFDASSFERIGGDYRDGSYNKDKNGVYYHEDKIEGADILTFELLGDGVHEVVFAKDINNAYFLGSKIAGAKAKTFEVLDDEFAKDGDSVYMKDRKIVGADVKTFRALGESRKDVTGVIYNAEDKNSHYFDSQVVKKK